MAFAGSGAQAAPAAPTTPVAAAAPGGDDVWSPIAGRIPAGADRLVNPKRYRAFELDAAALDQRLSRAPRQDARRAAPVTVTVPAPSGELVEFAVVESPIMEAGLAAAHPDITTYAGTAVGFSDSIRIDDSPYGLHASVRGDPGPRSWSTPPPSAARPPLPLLPRPPDLPEPQQKLVEPELDADTVADIKKQGQRFGEPPNGQVNLHTYRLALLTDPTYAEYVAPGSNAGTISDTESNPAARRQAALMDRVNQIYNDDLAVKMVLVHGTDKMNLDTVAEASGANGPCGARLLHRGPVGRHRARCSTRIADPQPLVVGQLIGAATTTSATSASASTAAASPPSASSAGGKAQGCTGLPHPIGDFYAVDYVAHEMGHQFSGNHTFNGNQVNCSTSNRNGATAVEPGSGSSVMAYAGICGSDDLQPHTDPYFSQRS